MKKKLETGNSKPETLEELLKKAGFQTLETPAPHVIYASGTDDFGKSHAAFLQSAGKHPAFIDSRKFSTVPRPVLIVHRRMAEEVRDQRSEVSETQPEKRDEDVASTEDKD